MEQRAARLTDVAVNAAKVLDNSVNDRLDRLPGADVALERSAADAVLLRKCLGALVHILRAAVQQGNVATDFCDGFRHAEANAAAAARDCGHLALHGEKVEDAVGELRLGTRETIAGVRPDVAPRQSWPSPFTTMTHMMKRVK